MDMIGKLVGGAGCSVDGTVTARNPLARLVDSVLDSAQASGGADASGRNSSGASSLHPGLQQGVLEVESANMYARPPPPPPDFMPPPPPPGQAMAPRGDPWAAEFMQREMHVPPDVGAVYRAELEEAFIEREKEAFLEREMMMRQRAMVQHPLPVPIYKDRMMVREVDAWAREMMEQGPRVGPAGSLPPEHLRPPPPPAMMMMMMPPPDHMGMMEQYWQGPPRPYMMHQPPPLQHYHEHPQQQHPPAPSQPLESAWDETREASAAVLRAMGEEEGGLHPKFAESEFVEFMRGLKSGRLGFQGNTVVPGTAEDVAVGQALGGPTLASAWEEAAREPAMQGVAAGVRGSSAGVDRGGLDAAVEGALEEAWLEAGDPKAAALEEMWRKAEEAGSDLDLDAFWDQVQSTAGEYAGAVGPQGDVQGLEAAWEQTQRELEAFGREETAGIGPRTRLDTYQFATDNPFVSTEDPFAEGIRLFEAGELRDAILAFEAEIQRHADNAEAWRMLGQSHAENDEDKKAIACLERAVEQDPYNLPALLALGVSYVNELDSVRALQNLKAWVQHNPKYQGLELHLDEYSDGSLMDEVTQLMLQAQDWDRALGHGTEDPDVQVVLGVLYNVSHDYDSAIEAFKRALEERPQDYTLWNKLGATLANGHRSEEALPAYHKALEVKPKYARAWLNMGISHANLSRYREASRCYLQALKLNPEATHIWGYLRVTLTAMERFDLVQLAGRQDPTLFDAEFNSTEGL